MSPTKVEDKKPFFAHEKLLLWVMSIATTALIAQATMSIQTYRELGVIQWQLADLQKTRDTYVTKTDIDGRARARDLQYQALESRVTKLETAAQTTNMLRSN